MKVLIIDDDPLCRMPIKQFLLTLSYIDIKEASSGKEGFLKALTFRPNIILSDYNMPPGINGVEMLESIEKRIKVDNILLITSEVDLVCEYPIIAKGSIEIYQRLRRLIGSS